MASRSLAEALTGAAVLAIAAGFLGYAVAHSGRGTVAGYALHARFQRIDGLAVGADVRLAGVKIGTVTAAAIDPKTFEANVSLSVADAIRLPADSGAAVTSDGLLGGKYLDLTPGGEEKMIPPGGQITVTQSSVNLEELLGKFVFSVTSMSDASKSANPNGADQKGAGQKGGAADAKAPNGKPGDGKSGTTP